MSVLISTHPRFRRALAAVLALLLLTALVAPSAPAALAQGGYAESFVLTGLVEKPKTFTQADLQTYPSVTLTAAFGAGQGFQSGKFTGVQLWDLLQEAKVQLDPARNNDRLRKYVVVTGSDGYDAIFSLAELDPDFGAEIVLIAYAKDGQPLGPSEGMARAVIGTDKRGGRLVSNVVRIEVRDVDSPPRSN
ncbi:MAG: molybdopterin-dependent oxidoreductase [Chloroflexi bacterium]|nr:molybdopterin-dependent oxidoreductase [Chloroflexota bacterium]